MVTTTVNRQQRGHSRKDGQADDEEEEETGVGDCVQRAGGELRGGVRRQLLTIVRLNDWPSVVAAAAPAADMTPHSA